MADKAKYASVVRTARARPKTTPSPTSRSARHRPRSRRARCPGRIAWPSTTSSCGIEGELGSVRYAGRDAFPVKIWRSMLGASILMPPPPHVCYSRVQMKWFAAALGIRRSAFAVPLVDVSGRCARAGASWREPSQTSGTTTKSSSAATPASPPKCAISRRASAALEERARSDLGMIAGNETFYQVIPPRGKDAAGSPPTRTAAR